MNRLLIPLVACLLAAPVFAQEVLDSLDLDAIRAKDGTEVIVEGPVVDVGTTKDGGITFLNIGKGKKEGFVAVVFRDNYSAFPDGFTKYRNQKVRVKGIVTIFRSGNPQIVVTHPDQITVVTE